MKNKKYVFFLIFAITALFAYVAIFGVDLWIGTTNLKINGAPNMRFGIDIRGGVEAVFTPKDLDRAPTADELESAKTIMETRLDQNNILDRDVFIDKQNGNVIVRFPWASEETEFNPEKAITELGETAKLTFRDPEGKVVVDGEHVIRSDAGLDQETGGYIVSLQFDEAGAKLFDEATARLVGQDISIYMDETLIRAPRVEERISTGEARITNMAGYEDAKDLSDKISAGALPFSMISRNHSTISPSLGKNALSIMVRAGFIALMFICAFLLVYYRLPGFVACIALLIQTTGQILALSIPQITLTLPGIAGIILSIGMGVDANVIISERISEEVKASGMVDSAIKQGFKRAFSSVFDGNITVLIVSVILMIFGSGAMLSFAYSLLTGIILNFIAGVTASRLMIRSLSSFKVLHKPALYKSLSKVVKI
ncbi:MAG: protein-export rane protein SecD [Clostridia bacterium]|nr:protein-export rane protein SecD [Clostridia bacterium]